MLTGLWVNPEVHADQVLAFDGATGFVQGFSNYSLFRCFICFDVAAGLSEDASPHGAFFNKQVFAFMLDDGGDCQVSWIHPCPRTSLFLDAELAKFHFDFTRSPHLVEHLSVKSRDGWFVSISDAFPARRLQAIDKGGFIGDTKRFGMGS